MSTLFEKNEKDWKRVNISAVEMVKSIKKGEITSEELVKTYIRELKKKRKMLKLGNSLMKNLQLLKQKN